MRFVLLGLCAGVFACTRTLPRRTVPSAEMPNVDLSQPQPPGTGRLVVDVPDGPVPVTQIAVRPQPAGEHYTFTEEPTVVCPATPCVLDLPLGNVALAFPVQGSPEDRSIPEVVHVGTAPTVFRRNLDLYDPGRRPMSVTGGVMAFFGVIATIVGFVMAEGGEPDRARRRIGYVTAASGLVLAVPGIVMARWGAATRRPGSSVHFPVP